jgi:hypothetical protein
MLIRVVCRYYCRAEGVGGEAHNVKNKICGSPRFLDSAQAPAERNRRCPIKLHINSSRCGNLFIALGMRAVISSLSRNRLITPRVHRASLLQISTFANGPQRSLLCRSPHHGYQHTLNASQYHVYHSSHDEATIYALSTASGRAAIAVIRVSGSGCREVGASSPYKPGMLNAQ